jgi:hypothetical protein
MDSAEADEERHKPGSGTLLGVFRHGLSVLLPNDQFILCLD